MKPGIRKLLISSVLLFYSALSQSQVFNRGSFSIISTAQVIPESYSTIALQPELVADPKANLFDINNSDTHLQVLIDNAGKKYHILVQTNFMGRVTFLSISNNLTAIFNKKDKPALGFEDCIRDLNREISPRQNIDAAINCIIGRLEYCLR
jgi:hypothetical protein